MTAAIITKPITIEQGATWVFSVELENSSGAIDLTGCSAHMQFRGDFGGPVALDLSSEQDTITLGGTAGTIEVEATASLTDKTNTFNGGLDLTVSFPRQEERGQGQK